MKYPQMGWHAINQINLSQAVHIYLWIIISYLKPYNCVQIICILDRNTWYHIAVCKKL